MKNSLAKLTGLVALSALLLSPAKAVTLTFNTGLGGAVGGEVGTIDPGSPSSVSNEVTYVNNLLGLGASATATIASHNYATTAFNFNGTVTATGSAGKNAADPGFSLSGTGFDWVLAKYGDVDYVWFVGGQNFTLAASTGGRAGGISHWQGFDPRTSVPDGGATALMLGAGMVGIALLGYRRQAVKA